MSEQKKKIVPLVLNAIAFAAIAAVMILAPEHMAVYTQAAAAAAAVLNIVFGIKWSPPVAPRSKRSGVA